MTARSIASSIFLPKHLSNFERDYLAKTNWIGLWFFALHVPVFALVAWFNETGPGLALVLTLAVLAGPAFALKTFANPRSVSVVHGFTAMLMGGLLVHFGQGPVQIEMHFYFFALIAMLALFGNPLVIVVAAVTVALHHLLLWIYLPASVFNYDAPIWVVAVHAAFVVLESVGTIFIARSFFDNVIGLEKIVQSRTSELDARNGEMRAVLDNVAFGFLLIDRKMQVLDGITKSCTELLDVEPHPGDSLTQLLADSGTDACTQLELAIDQVFEDILPEEVSLHQLPQRLHIGEKVLRIQGRAVRDSEGTISSMLLSINDATALEQARREGKDREVLLGILRQKAAFEQFVADARLSMENAAGSDEQRVLRRVVHTIKGNAASWGLSEITEVAHEVESGDRISDGGLRRIQEALCQFLAQNDDVLSVDFDVSNPGYEVPAEHLRALLAMASDPGRIPEIAAWVAEIVRRPARDLYGPMEMFVDKLAERLEKEVDLVVTGDDLLVDAEVMRPVLRNLSHLIRNSVDHGIEPAWERAGKSDRGRIELRTEETPDHWVVQVVDDGKGVQTEALVQRAIESGMLTTKQAATASEREKVMLIFEDGMSTANVTTEVSGRGVGMSAVAQAVREQGGHIRVETGPEGTCIVVKIPKQGSADESEAPSISVAADA